MLTEPTGGLPRRPTPGLRLISLQRPFPFRIDTQRVSAWTWVPFAEPRYRFDSAAGMCRVRNAGRSDEGAARERYRDSGSLIPADQAGHHLVTLTGRVRVLDLRNEDVLDGLGLDDQISTSRADPCFQAAHRLTDAVRAWWGDHVEGIAYRSPSASRFLTGSSSRAASPSTSPIEGPPGRRAVRGSTPPRQRSIVELSVPLTPTAPPSPNNKAASSWPSATPSHPQSEPPAVAR